MIGVGIGNEFTTWSRHAEPRGPPCQEDESSDSGREVKRVKVSEPEHLGKGAIIARK